MPEKKLNPSYKHIWSTLCQSSSIDRDTNRLSIFNVLEEITLKQPKDQGYDKKNDVLPSEPNGVAFEFEIMSVLGRLDDKDQGELVKEAELEFVDPQRKSLLKKNFEINFPKGSKRLRHRIKMNGLKFTSAGTYSFYLRMRESKNNPFEVIVELPLDIKF